MFEFDINLCHPSMNASTYEDRRRYESLARQALKRLQLERLSALLDEILPANSFYANKLADAKLPLESFDQLHELPFTFKEELAGVPESGDLVRNLTFPAERYVRFHETSGTRGRPLVVLDTADDWRWSIDCWQYVLDAAAIEPEDRAFLAFSFGPFLGFWTAHDALVARGCLVVPGGGRDTLGRLALLRTSRATAVFCTPSYALRMAEVAAEHAISLAKMPVRKLIVAGEPGGSIPAMRERIEKAWDAEVLDHSGATEIGPWGYGDRQRRGLHVIESEFIAEFLSVETGQAAAEGELAELVLTNLGRAGCPVIRYRTGDLVRPYWSDEGPNRFVLLEGGVLGRGDDMMIIRGVNIFPSSLEQILHSFPEIVVYRITAYRKGEMDQLAVEIEDRLDQPQRVADELRLRLGLQVEVSTAPSGTLPRFEGKGKRFVDKR